MYYNTTDRALSLKHIECITMNPNVEISSLSINKLKSSQENFVKYDIDVSLDEVENNESGIKLKYRFILLSNPTNTKISVEGLASLSGTESEMAAQLEPDQRNVPVVVNSVYQEIFPLFYVVSKSMQIPCPAYKLTQMSSKPQQEKVEDVIQAEPTTEQSTESLETNAEDPYSSDESREDIVQEANVSSN